VDAVGGDLTESEIFDSQTASTESATRSFDC
jgi:hypothetical protein